MFKPGDKVTFQLDPDEEILTVVESRPHFTAVVTFDGIDIIHVTDLLTRVEIPAAV